MLRTWCAFSNKEYKNSEEIFLLTLCNFKNNSLSCILSPFVFGREISHMCILPVDDSIHLTLNLDWIPTPPESVDTITWNEICVDLIDSYSIHSKGKDFLIING